MKNMIIREFHTAGTTLRYHVEMYCEGNGLIGSARHIPESYFRQRGMILRDESTTDLSQQQAHSLALKITGRIEVGRGWMQSNPELI